MQRLRSKTYARLAMISLAGELALGAAAYADDRVWAASGDGAAAIATDCGHCGDDVGMLLACQQPGAVVEVTVPGAAARTGKDNEPAPVTIAVGAQAFKISATTRYIAAIGYAPQFEVRFGGPLLQALQSGEQVRVRFGAAETVIALKGARVAIDDFATRCGAKAANAGQAPAEGDKQCSGHQMLPTPREESSCASVKAQSYPSPDAAALALVFPVDIDLYATPDMESRVAVRGKDGRLLNSKDFSSARGVNGYYVVNAQWSPDSQFFVFSLSSSGGHSPWSFPACVYSRETNEFVNLNQMIGGKPSLSPDFTFVGSHTLTVMTWEKEGSMTQVPATADLAAIAKNTRAPAAGCDYQ